MEQLIIQNSKRLGRLSDFVKSSSDTLTLGRGYKNDVILSDQFVAVEQICFCYQEGRWIIKVLDETNPVLLNNKPINGDGTIFNSGDELTVGRTHLTLLLDTHQVERTRKLMLANWMYHRWLRLALPFAMLLLSGLVVIFTEFQELSDEVRWGILAAGGLGEVVLVIFWASCWALIGRLLRHKPNFLMQLFYTAVIVTTINIASMFEGYIAYSTTSSNFELIIKWGFMFVMMSLLLKYNLSFATELRRSNLISFTFVATVMIFVFSLLYLSKNDFSSRPDYVNTVKPPLAKWSSDQSINTYMDSLETQFSDLKILKSESIENN